LGKKKGEEEEEEEDYGISSIFPNEKYHFRKIEFRAFFKKNKRKAKNREWKNNILYIYE
jgi:hypothetical protein